MCLAIPAKITELLPNDMLTATVGNTPASMVISGMLLDTPAEIGDYVIVHAGFALHKLSHTEAEESLRLLSALASSEEAGPETASDMNYDCNINTSGL